MTGAGWAGDQQAEEFADRAAVKAIGNVLGAQKLTCDEHENLQQDFKDGALEAYHQGRVAGLRDCEKELNRLAQRDSDYEDDIDGITEWVRSHIEHAQGEQP